MAEIDHTKQLKNVVGWFPRNSETEISKQEMCEGVVSVLTPVGKGGGGAELACGWNWTVDSVEVSALCMGMSDTDGFS